MTTLFCFVIAVPVLKASDLFYETLNIIYKRL